MNARPAVMRQNGKDARQLAKGRRNERGNKGGLQLALHKNARM